MNGMKKRRYEFGITFKPIQTAIFRAYAINVSELKVSKRKNMDLEIKNGEATLIE